MKNVNQGGLNELSQNELTQIEGGTTLKETVNSAIDTVNGLIEFTGIQINHWK